MLPEPLAHLDAFCAAHPLAPKVLLVPTVQAGDALIAALAERGRACINVRVATPVGWAERRVRAALHQAGWTRLTRGAERFVLREVLEVVRSASWEAAVEAWLAYQTPRTLQPVVHELRAAGVTATDVRTAPIASAKRRGLAAVLDAYAEHLSAYRQYDAALLFQRGIALGDAPDAWFAVLDGTPLSRKADQFIRAEAGDQLVRLGCASPPSGPNPPAGSASDRWDDSSLASEQGDVHAAADVWSAGLSAEERDIVRLRVAPGVEAEVRGVLRDMLARGIPFDKVEVAYTTADLYESQWHAAVDRFDSPATLATGRPMLQTPTGQALHGIYRWIAQGCDSELLAMWLRARLCTFDRVLDEPPDAPAVAAVLDQGGHGAGLHHQVLIDRLAEPYAAGDPERERLRRVRRALDALVSLVPREDPVTVDDLVTAGVTFVTWFGPGTTESVPVTSIIKRLRDVADAVGTMTGTRSQLASMMQRLVEGHRVEASAACPGALHVAPLDRAGYTGRPHVYVVGLDATSFSGKRPPDPVLPDAERSMLNGLIPRAARAGDAEWHLYRLMRAVPETVTLSARTGDIASGAEGSPSAFFLRVASQLEYADEAADVPAFPLVPSSSDLALDATEHLLARRAAAGFEEAVHAQAPWLMDGLHAQKHREAPTWTRFDGLTGRPAPRHALGTGDIPTSASRLETLAACPYRYFLQHVLEVKPPDVPDEDPTRWLDPLQFGALLHELFYEFMVRTRGRITDADTHTDSLEALLTQKIEAFRERIPVQHEAAFRADRMRLKRAARIFLAAEARRTEAEPVAFEVSFGQGQSGEQHRARPVPLALSDDVALLLMGRIDRVDRLPSGDYAIWDYKTGSMRGYDANDLQGGGHRLQWALYAYAFNAMLEAADADGTVQQSGYVFATARAYGQRLADSPPPREQVGAQLASLLDLAARGAFPHVQKRRGACRFCDYRRICADEATSARDVRAMTPNAPGDPISNAISRWMGNS